MIVNGRELATSILGKIKRKIKRYCSSRQKVKLASLSFRASPAYLVYQKSQKKIADYLGVDYQTFRCLHFDNAKAEKMIRDLNNDQRIHGIIVELPLPAKIDFRVVSDLLNYRKDIEGISIVNQGLLSLGRPFLVSPTALACFYIIKTLVSRLYGKNITIVGSSYLIGKPLAQLLLKEMATVSVTHIATFKSGNLSRYTRQADILISAVGQPDLINGKMVKKDAIVLDVGISKKRGKIVGDISREVREKSRYITPVPGGVGPLTTAFLFSNLLKAFLNLKGIGNAER